MADTEVVGTVPQESQELENQDLATTGEDDLATWKRRLAGKDQALTAAKKAADDLKSKYEELAHWKALQEEASLSEFEKAARRIKQLEDQLHTTETQYQTEKLASSYPEYFKFQEKVRNLTEVERAAEFENFVKQFAGSVDAAIQPVDANAPKRKEVADKPMKPEDIVQALRALGNPWQE